MPLLTVGMSLLKQRATSVPQHASVLYNVVLEVAAGSCHCWDAAAAVVKGQE